MNKKIAEVLLKQFITVTNNAKHSTIYFYMEKNGMLPEYTIHVETSKSHHWWSHARRQGFMFQKRIRPITAREFYKCIKSVDLTGIYVYVCHDEVVCQNNHARKFVLRCIEQFHKLFSYQDTILRDNDVQNTTKD